MVSVDVEDANAVTFDSYGKMDKENDNKNYEWKTKYGQKNEEHVSQKSCIIILFEI